jgi:hypothetical protein
MKYREEEQKGREEAKITSNRHNSWQVKFCKVREKNAA